MTMATTAMASGTLSSNSNGTGGSDGSRPRLPSVLLVANARKSDARVKALPVRAAL
jgi:hypothetical protein